MTLSDTFAGISSLLATVISWVTTISFYMAILFIGPWIVALVYDVLLYLWRSISYEIPVIGGRARGRQPPRPPTLTERPDGAERQQPPIIPLAEGVVDAIKGDEWEEVRRRKGTRRMTGEGS
ncbi:hypothetical protein BT63DRAFT_428638 [Microthyrium microscopicum]|uniref:Uncharacterized protein n=1 Tax=Microthyrium microscopicum TaxID=703497 RepID=A0A6A6U028_9PEZI|nr:hypothetical protein BT63DRAFT_428638 [Microthyrium microscopicum]